MIGHINVNSLPNKVSEIQLLLEKHGQLQILGITETRLQDNKHNNDIVSIPDYVFIRRDANFKLHTGIGVYIHNCISQFVKRRHDLETPTIENIWLEMRIPKNPPLLIAFVYRNGKSPDSWFENFANMLDTASSHNLNIAILGDFNIDLLPKSSSCNLVKKWQNYLNMYGLEQLIREPTRVEKLGRIVTSSLIDHIYVNCAPIVKRAFISHHSISDHKAIVCELSYDMIKRPSKRANHKYIIYRNFKAFSQPAFLNDLNLTNFEPVLLCADPNEAASLFIHLLTVIVNKHAPLRRKRVKYESNPAWLTDEIRSEMKKRDTLKKAKLFVEYKKQRNRVLTLVRKAKKIYFEKLVSNYNSKTVSIWRAINEFTKKSLNSNQTPSFMSNINVNQINNYFLSLTDSIIKPNDIQNEYKIPDNLRQFCNSRNINHNSFNIPLLSIYDVTKIVNKLKNKRTMDIFNLNANLLKLSITSLNVCIALTHVYNLSILNQTFPDKFKVAKIIPIPKTKDSKTLDNLRPISILPILSKPLEIHINTCLTSFLENNNLLAENQSGFRKHHSCCTALLKLCDSWLQAINEKKMVGAVFLDLRKAFDLVDHDILTTKLKLYLNNNLCIKLFSSYLSNRLQTVYLNSNFSSLGNVKSGVPQGSILGPILFSLFINDLPLSLSNSNAYIDLFADDSTLHTSDSELSKLDSILQKSINEIQNWCQINKMALHPQKTKSMLITSRQKRQYNQSHQPLKLSLNINNNEIVQVHNYKLLGVILDDEFHWTKHVDHISKKISRNIYLLRQLKHYAHSNALLIFFHAHCMSYFNYASVVWSAHTSNCNISRLNTLHRRAIKIISNEKHVATDQKLRNLGILSLKNQFLLNSSILMYKVYHGHCPKYLFNLFQSQPITIRLRAPNYNIPFARVDLFKGSFSFHGSHVWNSLPSRLRTGLIFKIGKFKKDLRQYLMNKD